MSILLIQIQFYISSELFQKLERDGFVGDELGKGKTIMEMEELFMDYSSLQI